MNKPLMHDKKIHKSVQKEVETPKSIMNKIHVPDTGEILDVFTLSDRLDSLQVRFC